MIEEDIVCSMTIHFSDLKKDRKKEGGKTDFRG